MKRLNALDWADGFSFVAYGVRLGLRVTVPETLPNLMNWLPPGWRFSTTRKVQWIYSLSSVPSRRKPGTLLHQLYSGGSLVTRGSDFHRVQTAFGTELRSVLALLSPWRTFVHAGAVGWNGKAILLPGSSGSGKTTLTEALVRAGATLYSDEFAVLDRRGRVHPYPLPLRVKVEGGEGPRTQQVPLEEIGGRAGTRPLPVGLVLATRYDPEAGTRLRRISPGRAALALLSHANQARSRTEAVMETLVAATRNAKALQGPRGPVEEVVDRILGLW